MTYGKRLNDKLNKLAQLFGANSGSIKKSACGGDWAGTYDYYVVFDNGVSKFICNGFKRFEENIDDLINTYEGFQKNKQEIVDLYRNFSVTDNEHAKFLGLKEYKVLDIDYVKDGSSHMGWFYIPIELEDGTRVDFVETGLCYNIKALSLGKTIQRRNTYFVAGGLKSKDVDFIFDSVGHSSKVEMYCL